MGHRVFAQDCWAGGYENNEALRVVAEANLQNAKAAGLIPVIYSNANPWWPVVTSVLETKANAGAMWDAVRIVGVDAEIAGISEANIYDLAVAFEAKGKKVCIYCGKWVWDRAGQPAWASLARFPLWTSDTIQHDPALATARRYGPWLDGQLVGRQYDTDSGLLGKEVDLNTFDSSFFEEGPVIVPTEIHDLWEEIRARAEQCKDVTGGLEQVLAVLETQKRVGELAVRIGQYAGKTT
jgi:hypothetical protein